MSESETLISVTQYEGLTMKPPKTSPQPGQVIIGYERFRQPADCCNCEGLTDSGYIWLLALFVMGFVFSPIWFFVCCPLCFEQCRKEFQRPVYGNPSEADKRSSAVGVVVQMQEQNAQQMYPSPSIYTSQDQLLKTTVDLMI